MKKYTKIITLTLISLWFTNNVLADCSQEYRQAEQCVKQCPKKAESWERGLDNCPNRCYDAAGRCAYQEAQKPRKHKPSRATPL